MTKQAIAGVVPAQTREANVMVIWPSIAIFGIGRFLGQLYSIRLGTYIFRLGNLIALATSVFPFPITPVLYLAKVGPFLGIRYRLTNQRIIVERGMTFREERSITLDRFDTINIEVQPGQSWFDAGDLIFCKGSVETFRLEAVGRPEAFRQICLKARAAAVGVQEAGGVAPALA